MTKGDDLLTKQEAADVLRCTVKTIDRMIARGSLKAYRPHGTRKMLVKRSELYKCIENSVTSDS